MSRMNDYSSKKWFTCEVKQYGRKNFSKEFNKNILTSIVTFSNLFYNSYQHLLMWFSEKFRWQKTRIIAFLFAWFLNDLVFK